MAYQTFTRSIESAAQTPLKPREVFSNAVGHVLNGFVDINRHHYAGKLAGAKPLSEFTMSEIVADQCCIDMNPFMQCMLCARTRPNALRVHQGLNQLLEVKTKMGFSVDGSLAVISLTTLPSGVDPVAYSEVHR